MASRYFWLLAFGLSATGFIAIIATTSKPTPPQKNIQKQREKQVQREKQLPPLVTQRIRKKTEQQTSGKNTGISQSAKNGH